MATAMSMANFQAACGECYDAISSEDWKSAAKWYAMAEAQNAALAVEATDNAQTDRRRDSLKGLKVAIETARSFVTEEGRTGGLIRTQTGFGK